MDTALLCLCLILLLYVASLREPDDMGNPADLAKLVDNMKRANGIVDRASADAAKHAVIMDSFEQRLNLNHENMSKQRWIRATMEGPPWRTRFLLQVRLHRLQHVLHPAG
jgi:hypothetical protein